MPKHPSSGPVCIGASAHGFVDEDPYFIIDHDIRYRMGRNG